MKQDRNPYLREDLEYFLKRRQNLIDAKFRALMYKIHEHKCPMCKESLHNGESVELHHIVPQRSGGKYRIENVLPLHQICHQQINHGYSSLERLKVAIASIKTPSEKKKSTLKKREPKSKKAQTKKKDRLNLLNQASLAK